MRLSIEAARRGYNVCMSDSAESVARAFVEAINRRDVEGLAALMTPEHRFIDSMGNVVEGREKMRAAWVGYFRMVPDYSIAIEEVFCGERPGEAGPSTTLRSAQDDSALISPAQGVVVMLGAARGTYVHPIDQDLSIHPNEQKSLAGDPVSMGTPGNAPGGELRAENRWETPAAFRAVVEDGLVAEWRVYADNEPMRRLMR